MSNPAMLQTFLSRHAAYPDLASNGLAHLGPLFHFAQLGQFPLTEPSPQLALATVQAISVAVGRPVTRVQPVSYRRPFRRPPDMSESHYNERLRPLIWTALREQCSPTFSESVAEVGRAVQDSLSDLEQDELWSSLDASLWIDLWGAMRRSFEVSLDTPLKDEFWGGIRGTIYWYLGSLLRPGPVTPDRFLPLVRLLPRTLPIGERVREPGAWISLAR